MLTRRAMLKSLLAGAAAIGVPWRPKALSPFQQIERECKRASKGLRPKVQVIPDDPAKVAEAKRLEDALNADHRPGMMIYVPPGKWHIVDGAYLPRCPCRLPRAPRLTLLH